MQNYFVWDGSPEIFTIPEIPLPFPVSVLGLILAYAVWAWFQTSNKEKENSKRKRKSDDQKKNPTRLTGLAILVGFQILGNALNLLVFDSFGPISVRWYGLLFAGSFVIGYQIAAKHFRTAGFTNKQIDSLLTYMIVAVVVGARLGHCLFYDPVYYLSNPIEILKIWEGGLASHGAAIGIVIAIYLFAQKNKPFSLWMIADRLMIPVAIGSMFIRLGNFFNSEIIGVPTDLPWAIIFARDDSIPRHPTMLYESGAYLICVGVLFSIYRRFKGNPPEGLMFSVFIIYMFSARFIIEFSKTSQTAFHEAFLSMGQWLSIPFILFGIWILVKVALKNDKQSQLRP